MRKRESGYLTIASASGGGILVNTYCHYSQKSFLNVLYIAESAYPGRSYTSVKYP